MRYRTPLPQAIHPILDVTIGSNVRSPNLAALATAAGWVTPRRVNFIITPGVNVAALVVSGFAHDVVSIVNQGVIGGTINGGTGLSVVGQRISIQNAGTIFGGGGKGGNGGDANATQSGGGSISAIGGSGGNGAGYPLSGTPVLLAAGGASGGYTTTYTGVKYVGDVYVWCSSGIGGAGGTYGAAGSAGGWGSWGGSGTGFGGAGTAGSPAGPAVNGNSLVTWITLGTIQGARIG